MTQNTPPQSSAEDPAKVAAIRKKEQQAHATEESLAEDLLTQLPAEKEESASGDFWFVLRKFSGGLVRTLSVVVGLGVLVWMIWSESPTVRVPDSSVVTEPISQVVTQVSTSNGNAEAEKPGLLARIFGRGASNMASEPQTQTAVPNQPATKDSQTLRERLFSRSSNNIAVNPLSQEEITRDAFFAAKGNTSNPYVNAAPQRPSTPTSGLAPSSNDSNAVLQAVSWHEWVVAQETPQPIPTANADALEQGMRLLEAYEGLFTSPMIAYVTAETASARQAKVTEFLSYIRQLRGQSESLRSTLSAEFDALSLRATTRQAGADASRGQINALLGNAQPDQLDALLQSHVAERNESYAASAAAEARRMVASRLQNFEAGVFAVEQNLVANERAIVQGIQVVATESDPFRRVLTPEQWRALGN